MDKPDDLHAREYAMQILENLGWPNDRGQSPNLLLITECLIAISKAKKLTASQAHSYMERALRLAREQGVNVDRFFFRDGVYMQMRPKVLPNTYRVIDKKRTAEEQAHPEWEEYRQKLDAMFKSWTVSSAMPNTGGKK
jgi:hypothetical protein